MGKIRFAVAEKDALSLAKREAVLQELPDDVEVLFTATSKREFVKKLPQYEASIDALILEIEAGGQSVGLDMASELGKPVLFISKNISKYVADIEDLEDDVKVVSHLTKPFTAERFRNRVTEFCKRIRVYNQVNEFVTLRVGRCCERFPASDIVFIRAAEKGAGAESNNKKVYFSNRPPLVVSDFSFKKIEEWNLSQNTFVRISKSMYVNSRQILSQKPSMMQVKCCDDKGKIVSIWLQVSENFRPKKRPKFPNNTLDSRCIA